jgi:hypothetical protein
VKSIARFFLSAKHWQIFLLLCLIPYVAFFSMPLAPHPLRELDPFELASIAVIVFYMLCFLGWFWSVGSFLNLIAEPALKLRTGLFQFSLIFPAAYAPLFFFFFFDQESRLVALILPLHLLAMFCLIYDLYFVAKSLVHVETGKPASFYDYAGPFFLI